MHLTVATTCFVIDCILACIENKTGEVEVAAEREHII